MDILEEYPEGLERNERKKFLAKLIEGTTTYDDVKNENTPLYLKDTSENREKLTELLGEGCTLFDDTAYIEVFISNRTWSTTPSYMWLYATSPELSTITEVNNLLRKNKIKKLLKNNGK